MGTLGQRYEQRWSENDAGLGGVGILVKEEISENVLKVRRKNDRVMATVVTLGKEMIRIICAYGQNSVMKKSCACQTLGFIRQTIGKSLVALVDVKQKLILCIWKQNTENM